MVEQVDIKVMIETFGWHDAQDTIISREGHSVDVSGDIWNLPITIHHSKLNFNRIHPLNYRWALKMYVQEKIQRTSSLAGEKAFNFVWQHILRKSKFSDNTGDFAVNKNELIEIFEERISQYRKKHILDRMYLPIQWYIWCAESYSELGFDVAYAMELDAMTIPGGPKGEAVRMEDPDKGPLHRSLEVPLLLKALKEDNGSNFIHYQERAVMALSLAFGRNAANLVHLQQSDFKNLSLDIKAPCYIISMPRIKKRQLSARDDLLDEYLDDDLARYISELILKNENIPTTLEVSGQLLNIDKPLFIKRSLNKMAVDSKQYQLAFNMYSRDISRLLKSFVKRFKIISPLTGQLMNINSRRLRYTIGTGLAAEGISKQELARVLDHTDTQHVQVYFDVAGQIVEHLDKASAKGFSRYLDFFKGTVIETGEEAVNGDREDKHLFFVNENDPLDQANIGVCGEDSICHLDPPYSCYLCPKFQPYRHANHEHVLDCLLENRQERLNKYEQSRLGIQLDEVITAVAQVVEMCALEVGNV